MTLSVVQSTGKVETSASSISFSLANVTAGNALVVLAAGYNASTDFVYPTGWIDYFDSNGDDPTSIGWITNVAAGTQNVTLSYSGSYITGCMIEVSGLAASGTLDVSAFTNYGFSGGTTTISVTGSTVQPNDILLTVINGATANGNPTWTTPTGMTSLFSEENDAAWATAAGAYQILTSAGPFNANWGLTYPTGTGTNIGPNAIAVGLKASSSSSNQALTGTGSTGSSATGSLTLTPVTGLALSGSNSNSSSPHVSTLTQTIVTNIGSGTSFSSSSVSATGLTLAQGGNVPISVIQSTGKVENATAATVTYSLSNVSSGNTLILILASASAATSETITAPGFTLATQTAVLPGTAGNDYGGSFILYNSSPAQGTNSVAVTTNSSYGMTGSMIEVKGLAPISPVDIVVDSVVTLTTSTSGTVTIAASGATALQNELVVAAVGVPYCNNALQAPSLASLGPGWVVDWVELVQGSYDAGAGAYKVLTTTETPSANWPINWGGGSPYCYPAMTMVTFKGATSTATQLAASGVIQAGSSVSGNLSLPSNSALSASGLTGSQASGTLNLSPYKTPQVIGVQKISQKSQHTGTWSPTSAAVTAIQGDSIVVFTAQRNASPAGSPNTYPTMSPNGLTPLIDQGPTYLGTAEPVFAQLYAAFDVPAGTYIITPPNLGGTAGAGDVYVYQLRGISGLRANSLGQAHVSSSDVLSVTVVTGGGILVGDLVIGLGGEDNTTPATSTTVATPAGATNGAKETDGTYAPPSSTDYLISPISGAITAQWTWPDLQSPVGYALGAGFAPSLAAGVNLALNERTGSSITGTLSQSLSASGSVRGQNLTSASLTQATNPVGTLNGTGSSSSTLTQALNPTGATSPGSNNAGSLSLTAYITSAATTSSRVQASLSQSLPLSDLSQASSSTFGSLSQSLSLSGQSSSQGSGATTLAQKLVLSGGGQGSSLLVGSQAPFLQMTGAISSQTAPQTSSIGFGIPLSGTSSAQSKSTTPLSQALVVAATVRGQSSSSATLSQLLSLTAQSPAQSQPNAPLTQSLSVTAKSSAESQSSATPSLALYLQSQATSQSSASSTYTASQLLSGAVTGEGEASYSLNQPAVLTGNVLAGSAATSILAQVQQLNASSVGSSLSQTTLAQSLSLSSSLQSQSLTQALLSQSLALTTMVSSEGSSESLPSQSLALTGLAGTGSYFNIQAIPSARLAGAVSGNSQATLTPQVFALSLIGAVSGGTDAEGTQVPVFLASSSNSSLVTGSLLKHASHSPYTGVIYTGLELGGGRLFIVRNDIENPYPDLKIGDAISITPTHTSISGPNYLQMYGLEAMPILLNLNENLDPGVLQTDFPTLLVFEDQFFSLVITPI